MRIKILDNNHIEILVTESEELLFKDVNRICIDTQDTLVCSSDFSASSFIIEKETVGLLFNNPLEIGYSTSNLLILFLVESSLGVVAVVPCYNYQDLLLLTANKSEILTEEVTCDNLTINNILPVLLYYAFKLALSTKNFIKAIKFWNRLHRIKCNTKLNEQQSSCGSCR